MKNIISAKLIVSVLTVIAAASIAAPASAGTVAGYYDQFGQYHFYDTYVGYPMNYGGYYNNGYYVGSAYDIYGVRIAPTKVNPVSIVPVVQPIGSVDYAATSNSLSVGTKTAVKTASTGASSLTVGSPISSLLGAKKTAGKLEITNIVVTSGPLNIYNDKTDVNCDITITWDSGVPTAGQVVYGTVSQPKVESFSYPSTAPESNSLVKAHSVKLGCLDNTTYYFRIVAFTATERVVSDEQVIFPIKIRTQIPVVGSASGSDTGASVLATVGKITTNPFVLIVLLGIVAYMVASRFARKGDGHVAHAEPVHAEPSLMIPHN